MNYRTFPIIAVLMVLFACSPQSRLKKSKYGLEYEAAVDISFCDSIKVFKTLYINKIDAKITINQEEFDAKVSIYYVPDSIFFLSAVNSGFEAVRIGILKDSTVYINRIDKIVYIIENTLPGFSPPVLFEDLEWLIDKVKICEVENKNLVLGKEILIDRSVKDIDRVIYFRLEDLALNKFEFLHKKTGEYVVGERMGEGKFVIYSNYIVEDIKIEAIGGSIEYDRQLDIDLTVNMKKYELLHL